MCVNIRSEWNQPRLIELRSPDGEDAIAKIDIATTQPQRFPDAHPRAVEQKQQSTERGCRHKTLISTLAARNGGQQQPQLGDRVDIGNEAGRILRGWRR